MPNRAPFLAALLAIAAAGCARVVVAPTWSSPNGAAVAAVAPWARSADLPSRSEVAAGQLLIHADFPLAVQHRLVRELETLRIDVSQTLGLPVSDEPVHLYLFDNTKRYDAFVSRHFPAFPHRRAFFIETDTTLAVFAAWQERVAEDLRHETTHGYVHAVMPGIPLWLDEGIAEFFEVPRSEQGVHAAHVAHLAGRLIEGTWQPDLGRLEAITSAGAFTQDHYAEAWCWTHWLLRTTAERRRLLQDHLTDVRREGPAALPLSLRLRHDPAMPADLAGALRAHVESLARPAE